MERTSLKPRFQTASQASGRLKTKSRRNGNPNPTACGFQTASRRFCYTRGCFPPIEKRC
ncbi:hypothetical protein HMPREF9120_00737 [Neisseria sp. oral taxon 020 str. F0370]|nr:hypothetical protein HMPREF9120_00737 [Neisseria sp. oral taxon 020 str. F0370]